jgi:hypothetical protein
MRLCALAPCLQSTSHVQPSDGTQTAMPQPPLPFQRISTHEWRGQIVAVAAAAAATAAAAAAVAPPPASKRPVGRPKRALSAHDVLAAAAATTDSLRPVKKSRGEYTDWFSSPYINDILREYYRDHRPAMAVQRLRNAAPDDRYDRLTHTTLLGWFDKATHKLLPRYQAYYDSGQENARQNGPTSAFEEMPGTEDEIKQTLLQMRAAGTAINSSVIRWVMCGIISHRAPVDAKIHSLKFGQQFISAWARKNLKWSWRQATTAASKLPLDWEEQGLQMAMRIAATMELKKVSQRSFCAY